MNVMSVLKAEISRLAKKEAKAVNSSVKKASASYRGLIAGLRKQVDALQKEVASLKKTMPAPPKALASKAEPEGRFWITGKGVKTMRKRTGLTQAKFAKLVGVSVPTVVNWEKAEGKVEIRRKETMARLQELKGKGKREVGGMLPKEAKKPKAKAKKA
ncbi:MAG: helix-turn-helix domain-containing protein [Verrucomicrobiota bacterium]|nr:helix-turn-helix domain-containing protein [Verrucomicrobiota bacterium]